MHCMINGILAKVTSQTEDDVAGKEVEKAIQG